MDGLFNHREDGFHTVTLGSKEGMIAVLNMSHYIQGKVMSLSATRVMTSTLEVIRFYSVIHHYSGWLERQALAPPQIGRAHV